MIWQIVLFSILVPYIGLGFVFGFIAFRCSKESRDPQDQKEAWLHALTMFLAWPVVLSFLVVLFHRGSDS